MGELGAVSEGEGDDGDRAGEAWRVRRDDVLCMLWEGG